MQDILRRAINHVPRVAPMTKLEAASLSHDLCKAAGRTYLLVIASQLDNRKA